MNYLLFGRTYGISIASPGFDLFSLSTFNGFIHSNDQWQISRNQTNEQAKEYFGPLETVSFSSV